MFELGKILMYKAVIHTISKERDMPVCSTHEIDHDDELTFEVLKNHIEKIMKSKHMKWGNFKEGAALIQPLEELDSDLNLFMELTKQMAYNMQHLIHQNQESIPSCDVAFVLFEMDNVMYLAGIKLNHKSLLVRKLEPTRDGDITVLNKIDDLFLGLKSKADEGFIIHLKFLEAAIVDKEYNVKGEKMPFIETFLNTSVGLSEKEKFKNFLQVNKLIQEKFIGEDLMEKSRIKKSISNIVMSDDRCLLDVKEFIEETFNEGEIKQLYKQALERAGIAQEAIKLDQTDIKKFDKQTIVTDSGINLSIPIDYFGNDERIEIKPNNDGTIDIVIKGIEDYKSN